MQPGLQPIYNLKFLIHAKVVNNNYSIMPLILGISGMRGIKNRMPRKAMAKTKCNNHSGLLVYNLFTTVHVYYILKL